MEIEDMIEEEAYYCCKKCKHRYYTKEAAIDCYKSHPVVVKIVDQMYGPPRGKPNQITVELDNGNLAIYNCVG